MRSQLRHDEVLANAHPAPQGRLKPIVNLISGDQVGSLFQTRDKFEERVSFGPMAATGLAENPAKWTSQKVECLGRHLEQVKASAAPVLLPVPMAALAHSNTALSCDAAVRRTNLCHQEIILELADAAFAGDRIDHLNRVAHLRRHGFNVGIDMRKSCTAPLEGALRILVDYIRIDADMIATEPALESVLLVAKEASITVIAENASWRDGDYLGEMGICAAISPRSDA